LFRIALLEARDPVRARPQGSWKRAAKDVFIAEDYSYELRIRGLGTRDLTLFVTGFAVSAPRIARVEYLADSKVIATVEGDPRRLWTTERYSARHRFDKAGTYQVAARAILADGTQLDCPGFAVTVGSALDTVSRCAATARDRNVWQRTTVFAKASSQYGTNQAAHAVDGLAGTRWFSSAGDQGPTLMLDLRKGVRAKRLILGRPMRAEPGRGSAIE
jgi:hypothetical protein